MTFKTSLGFFYFFYLEKGNKVYFFTSYSPLMKKKVLVHHTQTQFKPSLCGPVLYPPSSGHQLGTLQTGRIGQRTATRPQGYGPPAATYPTCWPWAGSACSGAVLCGPRAGGAPGRGGCWSMSALKKGPGPNSAKKDVGRYLTKNNLSGDDCSSWFVLKK